jgi:hypothetical protein
VVKTYVEEKYNFKFHFTEKNAIVIKEHFGCCSSWSICEKAGFCIIPKSYSNHIDFCGLGKRRGYDQISLVKIKVLKSKLKKIKRLRGSSNE